MWKQSYNACPTVQYCIDIGSVSVSFFKSGGHGHIGPLKQKSQGARPPCGLPPGSDAYGFLLLLAATGFLANNKCDHVTMVSLL